MNGERSSNPILAVRIWLGGQIVPQLMTLGGVVALFLFLGGHTAENMHRLGIAPGFSFLHRPADFEIGESLIAYSAKDSYARAILVGLLNTVMISAIGCLLATILGLVLGIARLSGNLLLGGLVRAYVEIVRNTPLLLQLFFWSATFHALPGPRQAFHPFTGFFLSNRGLFLPAPTNREALGWLAISIAAALALICFYAANSKRRGNALSSSALTTMIICVIVWPIIIPYALGVRFGIEIPELKGFNFSGGVAISPEFTALLVGLVVNSAATIAEIVRGSMESIPRGQWDAGFALGLRRWQAMRLIVLPQAMRVMIPLMISSYLNLTKNSSLAVAIGFPDLVSVINTSANQTGQAVETIFIMVAIYLALSLSVSAIMNIYHRHISARG